MIRKWIRRMIAEELEEELTTNALEYVNHDAIAESIDLETLAGHMDVSSVAGEIDQSGLAEYIDTDVVANNLDIDVEKVVMHMLENVNLNDFIENVGVIEVANLVYDMIHEKKEAEE